MMSNRKNFLSGLAVAALAPAAAGAATPAASPKPSASPSAAPASGGSFPFAFDHDRFDALTISSAKYKTFVAAAKIDGGRPFDVMSTIYGSYVKDVGVHAADVVVGAVLYHGASVALGLNDEAWKTIVKPAIFGMSSDALRNDLASSMPEKAGNPMDEMLAEMKSEHSPFFLCRWAFGGMVTLFARTLAKSPATVYDQLSHSLIENAMLVPSGVWAVAELQHRGFSYQQATL